MTERESFFCYKINFINLNLNYILLLLNFNKSFLFE